MLLDRLEELHSTKIRQDPEENDVVYFNAQEETMLKAIQTLGSVKVSSAYAALSCVVGGLKRVPHGKKSAFTVNTRYELKIVSKKTKMLMKQEHVEKYQENAIIKPETNLPNSQTNEEKH